MKTANTNLRDTATSLLKHTALLSCTLPILTEVDRADAALFRAEFSGTVAESSGPGGGTPQVFLNQPLNLNVLFNSEANPEPGGTNDFKIFGPDSISDAKLTSGPFVGAGLLNATSNNTAVTNQADQGALIGDAFDVRIENADLTIDLNLFSFPNIPPGPITAADLNQALPNLGEFGQGGFTVSLPSGENASGPFSTVSVSEVGSADFDRNGKVDQQDLAIWQANYGSLNGTNADANGDGRADGQDFLAWQREISVNAVSAKIASSPEPEGLFSSISATVLGFGSFLGRQLRKAKL